MTDHFVTLTLRIKATSDNAAKAAADAFCHNANMMLLPPSSKVYQSDPKPIFCAKCGSERGVPIPASCPHT